MGAAARASRRTVVDAATEAVTKTNDLIGRYNDVVRTVKAVETKQADHAKEVDERLLAHATWFERLEQRLVPLETAAPRIDRTLSGLADTLRGDGEVFRAHADRLDKHGDILGRDLWGRLRWLVTGQ